MEGSFYDKKYFQWQKDIGAFGGKANQIKFLKLISGNGQKVLDFGCGGGFLISSFSQNIDRYGVEINDVARSSAEEKGVKCFKRSADLPKEKFDLIISNNALEHTENPLQELKNLRESLVPGGKICLVVPLDNKIFAYKPNNKDYHLFSWSPMNLGNLLDCAGFKVLESYPFVYKWVPKYNLFVKLFGWKLFHLACRVYGQIERSWCQVRAVGMKEG